MAIPDGSTENDIWPLPRFSFLVKFGTIQQNVIFQEISGLKDERLEIEYRHGNDKAFNLIKMPGLPNYDNVVMKKGEFEGNDSFWDWFSQVKMNTIQRQTIEIELLDENGKSTISWSLQEAWPTKITVAESDSNSYEVIVDTIEFVHEGITVNNLE